jgi:hypothetical protein
MWPVRMKAVKSMFLTLKKCWHRYSLTSEQILVYFVILFINSAADGCGFACLEGVHCVRSFYLFELLFSE